MALLAKFFGRTASEGAAFALGAATSPVLAPPLETLRQEAWSTYPARIPSVPLLAEGVAQGQVNIDTAREWAKKQGYGDGPFNAMIDIANVGPGMAQAFHLWRRSQLDEAGFKRALKRLGLEAEWITALWNVREEVLDPSDLARAIHRGLIPDPGLLQGTLPSGTGNVPAYPVYPLDAIKEALAGGFDKDHLGVLVGLQGLPMGSHEAAQALFRGVLTNDDYLRAIAEGNTRNEWAGAIREQSRQIPSVTNYVEARIRGWLEDAGMYAGTGRHGMTPEDTDLLFKIHGRPISFHQTFIGTRRGGKLDGPTTEIDPAFLASLRRSDIQPSFYNLAWAQRYNYPSAFVLRSLTTAGDLTPAETEEILLFEGWEPTLAKKVTSRWAPTVTAAKENEWVTKAKTQLWTATHKAYVKNGVLQADAAVALTKTGLDVPTQTAVFELWDAERVIQAAVPPAPPPA